MDSFTYTITDGFSHYSTANVQLTVESQVLSVNPGDWVSAGSAGLTLQVGGDGKLHVYNTGTTTDAVPPHTPAYVTGISITGRDINDILTDDYIGGYASLLINYATFKINQDDAISAGTDVTIDGGILDLNGKTDTIGSLLLKSGSVISGTLYANSYTIENGTVTAAITGPGDLQKTTTGQATVGSVNTANTTVIAGELIADSIFTGTLTVGPGATVTITPIADGPQGTLLLQNTLTNLLTAAAVQSVAGNIPNQATVTGDFVQSPLTSVALVAEPPVVSTVLASPAPSFSDVAPLLASSDSVSNPVLNIVAVLTAIVADIALPVRLVESTPARRIDTAINRLLPQSPIYFRLDSTALPKIIESGLEQPLTTGNGNITSTPILGSLRDELPSRVEKIEMHRTTPVISSRQAHIEALQTNSRWSYLDAEADSDIAQHVRAGKHSKQFEKAIDEVLAEEEDAILALL